MNDARRERRRSLEACNAVYDKTSFEGAAASFGEPPILRASDECPGDRLEEFL